MCRRHVVSNKVNSIPVWRPWRFLTNCRTAAAPRPAAPRRAPPRPAPPARKKPGFQRKNEFFRLARARGAEGTQNATFSLKTRQPRTSRGKLAYFRALGRLRRQNIYIFERLGAFGAKPYTFLTASAPSAPNHTYFRAFWRLRRQNVHISERFGVFGAKPYIFSSVLAPSAPKHTYF